MSPKPHPQNFFLTALRSAAAEVKGKFALQFEFNPEDQLKAPVAAVLKAAEVPLGLAVDTATEAHASEGRPDIGVTLKSLLAGYVELKAPGKGANPTKFKGGDKRQWERFMDLPNLIYTDGNAWALYRSGEQYGKAVHLSGDMTTDGAEAITSENADALLELLRVFFTWEPIVPSKPRELAHMLAPICRLLRVDVLEALRDPTSNLSTLKSEWCLYLFPDADNNQFADAYAETLTYALLLAKLSGAVDVSIPQAAKSIRPGHRLLGDALRMLGADEAREEIKVPADLLERVIEAINLKELAKKSDGDPWLYFYEDFLAAYDPKMRKDRGVFYTPVPVVQAQVRLVAELLAKYFNIDFSFVDEDVVMLDPAAGTGTYVLAAVNHGLSQIGATKGAGMRAAAATRAAANMHAFEILVGPYAVAHLRLTQQIVSEGGQLPNDGVHVYLTDTLESPHANPPQPPLPYKELGVERKRAQKIKSETPVLVCMGNPPYDRQQIAAKDVDTEKRKGGWVRYGDDNIDGSGILRDFLKPLEDLGLGVHAKNLYNDYVYFWRWALWKVFESKSGPGIVSFITASSYLRGPGFAGMRKVMRETFDDLWIIDLEGDNLGARKTQNVFAIRTPVAIAIGVRYDNSHPKDPATVHYTRLEGTTEEKLAHLASVTGFADLAWRECLSGWTDPFLPVSEKAYWKWPLLTDLFPWQENGMQFKRSWPIAESQDVLYRRWDTLTKAPKTQRSALLRETDARTIYKSFPALDANEEKLPPIADLKAGSKPVTPTRYSYRSFDRQWMLCDTRVCDRPRPTLLNAHSNRQVYLISLLTKVLGEGPSAVAASLIPDLDHFCNRGARDVIPLWRNAAASDANVTSGLLSSFGTVYGTPVTAEDLFAYCYAVLATPRYVQAFWDELTVPGPRVPITKSAELFARAVALGRRLIWLHTYGERFVPKGTKSGKLPVGKALCKIGTPTTPDGCPEKFWYDEGARELHVGKGVFEHVRPEVYRFSVSGLEVVLSWLGYRMKERAGKKSSPLDDIRPLRWEFDEELLNLLWVLDATVDLLPEAGKLLAEILAGELVLAADLPKPTEAEHEGPKAAGYADMPLLEQAGIDIDDGTGDEEE